jgi:branched-chain amino acid transport system ATP-binding protein
LGIARSFQNVKLFPALTVRENIAVALERHLENRSAVLAAIWSPATRKVERRVKRRVENLVESLGLGRYADKFVNELSTGTRRIVDIACVLATQPRVLLLDEPSSGLAQAETEQLAPVIARIVQETNCGLLVIEHDLGLIAAVSDRLVAMRLGSVLAEGRPRAVLENGDVIDALLGGASDAVISRSIQMASAGVP